MNRRFTARERADCLQRRACSTNHHQSLVTSDLAPRHPLDRAAQLLWLELLLIRMPHTQERLILSRRHADTAMGADRDDLLPGASGD